MTSEALTPALQGALRELPSRIPPERIDRLWLFPPRRLGGKESGLIVFSLRPGAGEPEGQRQVVTLHYEAEQDRGRLRRSDTLTEQGRAPADRIPRMIAGVLSRLEGEAEEPRVEHIEGNKARWTALLAELGVPALDPANGE